MRIVSLLMVSTVISLGLTACAQAPVKHDFKPYLADQDIRKRSLWDNDNWKPQDWIDAVGGNKAVLNDFYDDGILTEQYTDGDNLPVLEVGETFMQLSSLDQRRVLQVVDHIFEITSSEENGSFYVYHHEKKSHPLGMYNKHGFQSY